MESSSNAWLKTRIEELRTNQPDLTISVVADQGEIKDGKLDEILPQGLSQSKHFRQDLNMSGSYWFYSPHRILLVQKPTDADDAKEEAIRASYRKLGATACVALQEKKTANVEILVTAKVADPKLMGVFENSFYLSNYENSLKSDPNADGDKKPEGEDADDRKKRYKKHIDSYVIRCEDDSVMQTEEAKFQRACMVSTCCARDLTNTRGSVATPEWMEAQVREIAKDHPNVKEVRVL